MVGLYLVQHGEAVPDDVDTARPLSQAGKKDVERLADFLARRKLAVSRILHSGKLRAQQTAELIAYTLPGDVTLQPTSGLAPNDPVEPWIQEFARWEDDALIVGHLPFLDKLGALLAAGDEEASILRFQPGAAACFERADGGGWAITWMIRPEVLR